MPALIMTGHPCTGKTIFAHILAERANLNASKYNLRSKDTTIIINEESACPDRSKFQCYSNSHAEKSTRSALKAEFDRHLNDKSCLTILDSLNYIKGYRYELHCITKSSGDKHGIVWVKTAKNSDEDGDEDGSKGGNTAAKQWNAQREEAAVDNKSGGIKKDSDSQAAQPSYYTDEIMDGLVFRYETPNDRNRWDKPLYHVHVPIPSTVNDDAADDDTKKGTANDEKNVVLSNVHPDDLASLRKQADEILESFLMHAKALKIGLSTQETSAAKSNVLHEVDNITQRLTTSILNAQKTAGGNGSQLIIPINNNAATNNHNASISLNRNVHLPELRRLRRQYVKWITSHPPNDTTEIGIATSFLMYIEQNV